MDNTEFDKLTKGSIVGFVAYPQFTGTVLATYVEPLPDIKTVLIVNGASNFKDIAQIRWVVVDLPPNHLTNTIDPKPQPIKAEYLTVVEYADDDEADAGIPEEIKWAVNEWFLLAESLLDKIRMQKKALGL